MKKDVQMKIHPGRLYRGAAGRAVRTRRLSGRGAAQRPGHRPRRAAPQHKTQQQQQQQQQAVVLAS